MKSFHLCLGVFLLTIGSMTAHAVTYVSQSGTAPAQASAPQKISLSELGYKYGFDVYFTNFDDAEKFAHVLDQDSTIHYAVALDWRTQERMEDDAQRSLCELEILPPEYYEPPTNWDLVRFHFVVENGFVSYANMSETYPELQPFFERAGVEPQKVYLFRRFAVYSIVQAVKRIGIVGGKQKVLGYNHVNQLPYSTPKFFTFEDIPAEIAAKVKK